MKTIGIRSTPSTVTFVIYNSATREIENIEEIKIPKAFNTPERLKYVRINLLDILREYEITHAGIRITENNARSTSVPRIQIEAIITEAFASSPLKKYYCGQISNISKLIRIERSDFKKYIDGTLDFTCVENWCTLSKDQREACLVAIGAVNA